jgi:PAS domain S-box-containing protein
MRNSLKTAENLIDSAVAAVCRPVLDIKEALDAIPAPIYVTDADGLITHFNRACIPFAGRTPELGTDRWCVTWKLFTADGEALPHEACPMAVAIREGREVRGVQAYAERPDGTRVRFQPFPTPLFDEDGRVTGAINLLIDVTDGYRAEELRSQAARCRRLASSALDRRTLDALDAMASEYEEEAGRLALPN